MNKQQTDASLAVNAAVTANAVALVANVVSTVAGNAIANTIGGQQVAPAFLQETVAARLKAAIAPQLGG